MFFTALVTHQCMPGVQVTEESLLRAFDDVQGQDWLCRFTVGCSSLVFEWHNMTHLVIHLPYDLNDLVLLLFVFFKFLLHGGKIDGKALARFSLPATNGIPLNKAFPLALGFPLTPMQLMDPSQIVVYTMFAMLHEGVEDDCEESDMQRFRREYQLWQKVEMRNVRLIVGEIAT